MGSPLAVEATLQGLASRKHPCPYVSLVCRLPGVDFGCRKQSVLAVPFHATQGIAFQWTPPPPRGALGNEMVGAQVEIEIKLPCPPPLCTVATFFTWNGAVEWADSHGRRGKKQVPLGSQLFHRGLSTPSMRHTAPPWGQGERDHTGDWPHIAVGCTSDGAGRMGCGFAAAAGVEGSRLPGLANPTTPE